MKKLLNITHRDFDGVVSAILLNDFCNKNGIEFEYMLSTYRNIDKTFRDCYDITYPIFITDISIVDESAFPDLKNRNNIFLIDHHPRPEPSVIKNQHYFIDKGAGCMLVHNYIESKYKHVFSKELKALNLLGNDHDLWIHKFKASKLLNRLFYTYGAEDFFKRFKDGFDGKFTDSEKAFFKFKEEELQKLKNGLKVKKLSDNVCFVCASKEIDEVAEFVKEDNGVEYVIVYNNNSGGLSFRSNPEAGIDLGKFLTTYGGGGHFHAAALRVKEESKIYEVLKEFTRVVENV